MSDFSQALKGKSSDELKWLELVIQHVGSLRYGVVEIVVHDSRVIQIEKTERVRLEKSSNDKPSRET
ncbi:MAG TPA: YezD family protein [Pseudomonadales bacterium]|nr:YezD family protein [Pseudomonadales bacterium]